MDAFNFGNSQTFHVYAWLCCRRTEAVEAMITKVIEEQDDADDPWLALSIKLEEFIRGLFQQIPARVPHNTGSGRTMETAAAFFQQYSADTAMEHDALFIPLLGDGVEAIEWATLAEALLRRADKWRYEGPT